MSATNYIFLFIFCLLTMAFLLRMLFPISWPEPDSKTKKADKQKPRGYCPLCGSALYSGQKVRSKQTEIGNIEVQTCIRGCVHCVKPENKIRRRCPVCKQDVAKGDFVLAISDPRVDRLKLSIKGCQNCFTHEVFTTQRK